MGVLYLVRHGQAPAHAYTSGPTAPDAPGLTELGFAQARATGLELARQVPGFTTVISGGLPRQRATLATVLEAFSGAAGTVPDGPPIVDPGWDEYPVPELPGGSSPDSYASPADYQRLLDAALDRWVAGDSGSAESYTEYTARTTAAAERATAAAGPGETVLAVSSAGTITALVARAWGVPAERWPGLARAMVNASITRLLVGRRGLTVLSVNEHAHLSATAVGLATFR
ncbi:MAG: histidine phosphatase family protein [Gordonia sp. (in: high G+C Gram-positive bacteria)]|uniref:histidine phosphatase family protein n=1 Tax=Gordonia sp. (in: high G+C Gram-positive bacteria) TaxID=84139 RepID=UPI0039E22F08